MTDENHVGLLRNICALCKVILGRCHCDISFFKQLSMSWQPAKEKNVPIIYYNVMHF